MDYPHAFVIMPFSEPWSDDVYNRMIKPAIQAGGLESARRGSPVRIGDLTTNIWNEILFAGILIAEVSVPNVNVFYELGLAHALGKDVLFLKNKDARLPADFGGIHYYEYDLNDLRAGCELLTTALKDWVNQSRASAVQRLYPGHATSATSM